MASAQVWQPFTVLTSPAEHVQGGETSQTQLPFTQVGE